MVRIVNEVMLKLNDSLMTVIPWVPPRKCHRPLTLISFRTSLSKIILNSTL
jgi:hypothetical protein